MSNAITAGPGTVIRGTMRPYDLIPAFLEVLRRCEHPEVEKFTADWVSIVKAVYIDPSFKFSEESRLLTELFDVMDDVAPEGCVFGANEGDSSDYGFWPVEEE